jgi:hypothetical protein
MGWSGSMASFGARRRPIDPHLLRKQHVISFSPFGKEECCSSDRNNGRTLLARRIFNENITEYLIACDPGPIKEMR